MFTCLLIKFILIYIIELIPVFLETLIGWRVSESFWNEIFQVCDTPTMETTTVKERTSTLVELARWLIN